MIIHKQLVTGIVLTLLAHSLFALPNISTFELGVFSQEKTKNNIQEQSEIVSTNHQIIGDFSLSTSTIPILPEKLRRACGCESVGDPDKEPLQHDKNGSVVVNHNTNGSIDYGACQINDLTWDQTAQELGLDYKNLEADNYELALYIHSKHGLTPWSASMHCWIE